MQHSVPSTQQSNYCCNKERILWFLLRSMIAAHLWFPSPLQVKEQSHSDVFGLITVDLPCLVLISTINWRLTGLVVVPLIKSCTCPVVMTLQSPSWAGAAPSTVMAWECLGAIQTHWPPLATSGRHCEPSQGHLLLGKTISFRKEELSFGVLHTLQFLQNQVMKHADGKEQDLCTELQTLPEWVGRGSSSRSNSPLLERSRNKD